MFCKKQDLAVLCICFARKLSRFSDCILCCVLLGLPSSLGPLGGSHDGSGLATIKPRCDPAHDLESLLSNHTHRVPDLAGEGPLSRIVNQSTRTWVQGLKGSRFLGPRFEVLWCLS
jgi:hypothetical protein